MATANQTIQSDKIDLVSRLKRIFLSQEGILFLIMIVMTLILATRTDKFLTVDNLLNQGRLLAEVGLVALPMTYIIITGGIDLSVGSILGLSAVMLGYSWQEWGLPLEAAIVVALLTGVIAGWFNGLLIIRVGIPPLIMTLATLALYRGLALGISQAGSVRGYPDWFNQLGQGSIIGIPTQVWLLIISTIIFGVVLARTVFGRTLYSIGNNELATRFAGLQVNRAKLIIYTLSGLMAGLAGYISVSRFTTTRSDLGTALELDVIAAVVLGGTSIFGGTGSILGTIFGVILIALLRNGLSLIGITGDATIVVIGLVLIFAILVNNFVQSRMGNSK